MRVERTSFLPFAIPDCGDEEIRLIEETVRSGWLTTGPMVKRFEAEFGAAVGADHAVAVNSCTAALHLSLEAVGLASGDEVITSPYTFAATAEVVRYFGARPVFVDIDPRCLALRPDLVEKAITPRTKAIIPVHVAGLPADLDPLLTISGSRGIPLIEDAAHAFPAQYKGRRIGSIGSVTCFSFYATKTLATGEGGMICTNDAALADRCRIMSLHGISRDAWKRYTAEGSWYYEIIAPGFKYNMTDVAAAMGIAQLRKAEGMLARRKAIADRYHDAFRDDPALEIPHDRIDCGHAWHLYMLRLRPEFLRIDRAQVIEELKKRQIGTSVHFIPLHLHPYYRDLYGFAPHDFPAALHAYERELSLPIYSKMSDGDVQSVIDAVLDVVRAHAA